MSGRRRGTPPPTTPPLAAALRDALAEAGLRATPRHLLIVVDALVDELEVRRIDIVHEPDRNPAR
jgi:hypothetical protein